MSEQIIDGTGTGYKVKIDSTNKMGTRSVTTSDITEAAANGDAYNLNTGKINLTGAAASAIMYVQNNEPRDLYLDFIGLGVSDGTVSDIGELVLIRNPTAGDLITDATDVDMNANRNAGSNKVLAANVYKGKDGGTVTGGNNSALFFHGDNARLFGSLDIILPRGHSIGITYDPNLASGSVNVYAVLICHLLVA